VTGDLARQLGGVDETFGNPAPLWGPDRPIRSPRQVFREPNPGFDFVRKHRLRSAGDRGSSRRGSADEGDLPFRLRKRAVGPQVVPGSSFPGCCQCATRAVSSPLVRFDRDANTGSAVAPLREERVATLDVGDDRWRSRFVDFRRSRRRKRRTSGTAQCAKRDRQCDGTDDRRASASARRVTGFSALRGMMLSRTSCGFRGGRRSLGDLLVRLGLL